VSPGGKLPAGGVRLWDLVRVSCLRPDLASSWADWGEKAAPGRGAVISWEPATPTLKDSFSEPLFSLGR
jgi:hypothetical protein